MTARRVPRTVTYTHGCGLRVTSASASFVHLITCPLEEPKLLGTRPPRQRVEKIDVNLTVRKAS